MLVAIAIVICGTAALMIRNVYYTDGELMQWLYGIATVGTATLLLLGRVNRLLAAWLIVTCGGALILWQARQQQRWAVLHEQILSIIHYVKWQKEKTGSYPANLDDYPLSHPEFKGHMSYSFREGRLFISYYLNQPGISYWYDENGGFGYYGD